jgi:hypothetical protein
MMRRWFPTMTAGAVDIDQQFATDSRILESVEAGFGLACSQGAGDNGAVVGGTAFIGVTRADPDGENYRQRDTVAVLVTGDVLVRVSATVTPSSAVKYDQATGQFGSANGIAITKARYMTTSTMLDDLVILRLR